MHHSIRRALVLALIAACGTTDEPEKQEKTNDQEHVRVSCMFDPSAKERPASCKTLINSVVID